MVSATVGFSRKAMTPMRATTTGSMKYPRLAWRTWPLFTA